MNTPHQVIIKRWPSIAAIASDLGLPYERVKKWWQRGVIPSGYWADLVAASHERRLKCSLSELASQRRQDL